MTADNPKHLSRLASLDHLVQQELNELNRIIGARETRGREPAARLVLTGEAKLLMDRIRAVIAAMQAEEDQLLSERAAREDHDARPALGTTVGGLASAVLFILVATVLLTRAVRARGREAGDRMAAEAVAAAVAESAERLRVTLTSIGDAVIATDARGRVTLLNAVAQALTGWTEAEATSRLAEDVFVIVDEQSRRSPENPVQRVLREGVVTGLANHTLLISRDGREIPIDNSAAPINAADGSLLGVILVFRDITERKNADERFRLAVEAAPTALVMVDQRGSIRVVNALTEQLFGYPRHELVGRPIEQLIPLRFRGRHPMDRTSFSLDPRRRPMGAGRDLYALRKDGTEIAVEIGLSPCATTDGAFVLAAIADITERKRGEQRQATLHTVARALADSTSLTDATVPILQAICTNLEWDLGALWMVDRDVGVLRCVDVWHRASVTIVEFEAIAEVDLRPEPRARRPRVGQWGTSMDSRRR